MLSVVIARLLYLSEDGKQMNQACGVRAELKIQGNKPKLWTQNVSSDIVDTVAVDFPVSCL